MSSSITKMHAIYNKLYRLQAEKAYEDIVEAELLKPLSDDQKEAFIRIIENNLGSSNESSKKTSKRKKKDPNAPKRPATAFISYLNKNRAEIKKLITEEGGDPTVSAVGKKGGVMWKALSDEDKQPWVDKFKAAMDKYNENITDDKKKKNKSSNSTDDATEDGASANTKKSKVKKNKKKKIIKNKNEHKVKKQEEELTAESDSANESDNIEEIN